MLPPERSWLQEPLAHCALTTHAAANNKLCTLGSNSFDSVQERERERGRSYLLVNLGCTVEHKATVCCVSPFFKGTCFLRSNLINCHQRVYQRVKLFAVTFLCFHSIRLRRNNSQFLSVTQFIPVSHSSWSDVILFYPFVLSSYSCLFSLRLSLA